MSFYLIKEEAGVAKGTIISQIESSSVEAWAQWSLAWPWQEIFYARPGVWQWWDKKTSHLLRYDFDKDIAKLRMPSLLRAWMWRYLTGILAPEDDMFELYSTTMAKDPEAQIRLEVAGHYRTRPATLWGMRHDKSALVRAAIAKNRKIADITLEPSFEPIDGELVATGSDGHEAIMRLFSMDKSPVVRTGLAWNSEITEKYARLLANDKSPKVRSAIRRNANLPKEWIK